MSGQCIDKTIEIILKEYPGKIRCLQEKNAEYVNPNRLRCRLYVDPNWAWDGIGKKCPVDHLTASEATFAHNQMAFVLLTYMAQHGYMEGIKPQSLDTMNNKKFKHMVIRDINIKFKKEISTSQPFNAEFYVESQKLVKTSSGYLYVSENRFNFEGKSAYGMTETVLTFNEDEIYKGKKHEEIYQGRNI